MNSVDPNSIDPDFNNARHENLLVITKCQEYVKAIEEKLKLQEVRQAKRSD